MAERAYTVIAPETVGLTPRAGCPLRKLVKWTGLTNGDTGIKYPAGRYAEVVFEAYGTWGTGGTAKLYGTLEDTTSPTASIVLKDKTGADVSFTANGIVEVRTNATYVWPAITNGDTTTTIVAYVLLSE